MNRSQSFDALIDLIELDTHIQSQQQALEKVVLDEKNFINQQQILEQSVLELKHAVLSAKKRVDVVELTMKDLDEQEKNKKKHIDQLTGYKEYKSLQIEINNLHEDQRNQEQAVIDAWNAFDLTEARCMQQLPILQEKMEKIHEEIEQCRTKQLLTQQNIITYQDQRPTKQALVPAEWMEKYILMQSRVKNPVVPIESNVCTACFYQLTPTDIQFAKKGTLVQCKSCFRLLYIPDVMQVG
jgi:predicted  nucleic acid-binding Zn-ribbon protein